MNLMKHNSQGDAGPQRKSPSDHKHVVSPALPQTPATALAESGDDASLCGVWSTAA